MLKRLKREEISTYEKIENFGNPFLDDFFRSYTSLGSFYIGFTILAGLWYFLEISKAVQITAGLSITWFGVYGIKYLIKRERPEDDKSLLTYSFPSGHAATAFFFAPVLSSILPELRTAFYIVSGLVAFSRVYLKFHFPADIIAGSSIGFLAG